jgi:hypothetical protein
MITKPEQHLERFVQEDSTACSYGVHQGNFRVSEFQAVERTLFLSTISPLEWLRKSKSVVSPAHSEARKNLLPLNPALDL